MRFLSQKLFKSATAWLVLSNATTGTATMLVGNNYGVIGINASYDYVVVGGGTSGLAIAARLAEIPGATVAVVEAGGFYEQDNGNGSTIPGVAGIQYLGTDPTDTQPLIDWGFVTTPQAGANGRQFHYARGKTLGGSSARNYMTYSRPAVGSMQKWADQVGDDSYLWENVLPYFKQSPTVTPPNLAKRFPTNSTVSENCSSYDNTLKGPLQVTWPNWASPFSTWVLKGLNAVGVPTAASFTSGSILGAGWCAWTLNPKKQARESSQSSFLNYAFENSNFNFYLYKNTLAKKILFNSNKTATGVLVSAAGVSYVLNANKEVIVSAGVFQSPQLLMVSGIGPSSTLSQYNITVLSNLPGVGQNLQDQPLAEIIHRVNVNTASKFVNDPAYAAQAGIDYLTNQTGPFTQPGGIIAWEKIPHNLLSNATVQKIATLPDDWPEIEYLVVDAYMGYNRQYETADPHDGFNYGSLAFALQSPFSRGNVSISSDDMSDPPVINPNWITDPADVDIMIAGFKRVRDVYAAIADVTIGDEVLPGKNVTSDDQILDYIKEALVFVYHAAGTCAMWKAGDSIAVVDSEARVFGVNGLRVVDASIFPFLPAGHPQGTCYMLAEKIADDIKKGY